MKYAYLYIVPFFLLQSCDYFSIKNEAKDAVARVNTTYLYKEDFADFKEALDSTMNFILSERGKEVISERHQKNYNPEENRSGVSASNFSDPSSTSISGSTM